MPGLILLRGARRGRTPHSFELSLRSLLQGAGLPFTDALDGGTDAAGV